MTKIKSKSAAIAMIVCFAAEIVFSNALQTVFSLAGKAAPICVLLGGAATTLIMPISNKLSNSAVKFTVAVVYTVIVIMRLISNASYLYNKQLTLYIVISAFVLLIVSAIKGLRGAGIYCALCFVPLAAVFAVCCIFGSVDINLEFFKGVLNYNILSGTVAAVFMFVPFMLCASFVSRDNIISSSVVSGISFVLISVMMLIAVGVFGSTADDYPSVISEMSKNVSIGKFFQRLEGFADASYILSASAVITTLGAIIGECLKISGLKLRKSALVLCAALLVALCGCTAKHEIETQTFVVVTVFDGDKIHLMTESGRGGSMYSASTSNLTQAIDAIENSESINISLLQSEMVIIGNGADVELAMDQTLKSDMPNSAAIMLSDCDFDKMYSDISESYPSVFDFAAAIQSSAERFGYVCEPASALKAEYEEKNRMTVGILDENGIIGNITIYKG